MAEDAKQSVKNVTRGVLTTFNRARQVRIKLTAFCVMYNHNVIVALVNHHICTCISRSYNIIIGFWSYFSTQNGCGTSIGKSM